MCPSRCQAAGDPFFVTAVPQLHVFFLGWLNTQGMKEALDAKDRPFLCYTLISWARIWAPEICLVTWLPGRVLWPELHLSLKKKKSSCYKQKTGLTVFIISIPSLQRSVLITLTCVLLGFGGGGATLNCSIISYFLSLPLCAAAGLWVKQKGIFLITTILRTSPLPSTFINEQL